MADMNKQTKQYTEIALMSAVLCILGPLAIPLPFTPVPLSFTMIGVYLAVYVLGMRRGTAAVCVYLLLGGVGLPVFSGFTGGPAKLFGPTGGYLVGFLFTARISGFFIERWWKKRVLSIAGMLLGIAAAYAFGSIWLAAVSGLTLAQAVSVGVLPYILFDLLKIVLTAFVGTKLKKRMCQHGIF